MKTPLVVACALAMTACDDDTAASGEAAMDLGVRDLSARRTADIALAFQPEGLWWDASAQTLFIATDAQQIVKWDEPDNRFDVVVDLPQIAPSGGGLGQLVEAPDGSWLVTRFGFGVAGAVLQARSDGSVAAVAGLDAKRRRIGLTVAPDGTIYDGWYLVEPPSKTPMMGTVSQLALDGSGETDVVTGIGKPVGVLALGDQLYVSDPLNGVVLKTPLASPGTTTTFATVAGADELAAGPNGTILAASSTGTLWSIAADGSATSLKSGYKALRGVAYDGDRERVFISEPDAGKADGGVGMPMLHVVPIE